MRCKDIMSTNLEWLLESATVQQAAAQMAEQGVGFLPICDAAGQPLGVVTDRDLAIRAIAKSIDPQRTTVTRIMTSPVVTCLADSDISEAEQLMAEEQKARLVIVEKDGRTVGVLSLADLLEHAPQKQALATARAVLWREALGPRGGAAPGDPLLTNDPVAHQQAIADSKAMPVRESVVTGGHRSGSMKEFPG
jgi:CBS domain-containing protein